ncbi:MAG: adenylosuccinate lyase [Proteobacteria bacterium]|nr:adenylosuccinate lyase [Pseudomonadota bacterium]
MESIMALSVLDGRYKRLTNELRDTFSEYGLIKFRVRVEIEWLKFLVRDLKLADISEADLTKADGIMAAFNGDSALRVKAIEKTTNHDVKAVEYYIKEELDRSGLSAIREWVHFSCTSDDINNTAYALMIKEGISLVLVVMKNLLDVIETLALTYKGQAMMSRTHGQPATPTTTGKEMVNFAWRLRKEIRVMEALEIEAKMNGATGNFNAHVFAFPDIDWIAAEKRFITDCLGLKPLLYTTQINPNSYISQTLHSMIRAAAIIIDIDRDMWGYISLGYFKQKLKDGEVGSSTMPHKVNPIDFENSEGNMGIAISMMEHLSVKLLQSRFQRDLTDSTVLRNMGALFGYYLIGLKNAIKGMGKLELNRDAILKDLHENQELLAEPIQTVMRVYGEDKPYEKLKELTRGVKITRKTLSDFIAKLTKIPPEVKERMMELSPETYTGLAEQLVDEYFREK